MNKDRLHCGRLGVLCPGGMHKGCLEDRFGFNKADDPRMDPREQVQTP